MRVLLAPLFLIPAILYCQQPTVERAQSLLREGKANEALSVLLELYKSDVSSPALCQQIGIAYTQLENLPKAEEFYRKAIQLNPQFHAARKNLATVLWFLGRKDEAEREFLSVNKALAADPVPHLYLGLAEHGRRHFEGAKAHFQKAGTLASANPEVLPTVLETYLATRDLSLPNQVMKKLARAENPDPALTSRTGAIFAQYGYYDQAVIAFEKLVSARKDSAETWRMLAEAYDRQNKPDQAYRAYARAIEMDPKSDDAYLALAEFASAHHNDDFALDVVGRGLQHSPGAPGLLFERGILRALKGDRDQAENDFRQASQAKPDWNLPLLAIGVLKLESGNAAGAAATFEKSRAADPRDYRAHYLYAVAVSRDGGQNSDQKRARALGALRRAIELNPNDARTHALLGQLSLAAGDAGAAAIAWRKSLKIDPENPTALYQLSLLYRKQGKTQEADRMVQTFRQLKAGKRDAEESLVQILRVLPAK
jgi:tetratricopeptide (TPR) repeat protein